MDRGTFAEIEHTADLGLDLDGPSPGAVLEAAQRGIVHLLFGETPDYEANEEREIVLQAASWPELLKTWLEALYRLIEEEGFVPLGSHVEAADPAMLRASVAGARPARDELARASELKAVTYHQLAFQRDDGGWTARVIFDV